MRHVGMAVVLFLPLYAGIERAQGNQARTAEEIYRSACSSCHGVDGRGAAKSHVGFDLPLPDFTDCSFATREPDIDWNAVSHEGGPGRAFSKLMPAFGDALSSEDIQMATAHVRTFCSDKNWPAGELNLPRPLVLEKAYPEDEAVFTSEINAEGAGGVFNKIVYEKRFGARNQFELVIPFHWREEQAILDPASGNWRGGVGDIALGAKRALFHSSRTGSIFSVTGEIVLPTGDRDKGFGTGTTIFEPFVSYGQILPSNFFFQAQTGVELPFDTNRAERAGFWRFALGRSFTQGNQFGRTWSPMLEVLAAREFVAREPVLWDLVPQMQVTLSRRQHIMMNFGVRLPVTDSGPRNTQFLFYLLWDWFDGGLFDGW